jgi:LmbE family N-acetylglucosaminyl deacetylase
MDRIILTLLAHPDDAEFLCAGTLTRLVREHGWQAHIATMTAGDCGSTELPPEEISRVRRGEAAAAAAIIGASYHCLEERDLLVCYNETTLGKFTRLLREIQPSILLTHSPTDYLVDHEITSLLARSAAFAAPVPNFLRDSSPPLPTVPTLYYCDPVEGKDVFGRAVEPRSWVDISDVIDVKEAMLGCHISQRDWLRRHHGIDHYLQAMREWSARRGRMYGVAFAEGFRQHLGHGYPNDDLLSRLLNARA